MRFFVSLFASITQTPAITIITTSINGILDTKIFIILLAEVETRNIVPSSSKIA